MSEVATRLNLQDGASGPLANIVAAMNNTIQVMESLNAAVGSVNTGLNSVSGNQGTIELNTNQLNSAEANIQDVAAELNALRSLSDVNVQVSPSINTQAIERTQNAISGSVNQLRELASTVNIDFNTQEFSELQTLIDRAERELLELDARANLGMNFDTASIERSEQIMTELNNRMQDLRRSTTSLGDALSSAASQLNSLRNLRGLDVEISPEVNTQALQNTQDVISRSINRLRSLSATISPDVDTSDLERMQDAIQRAELELTRLDARAQFDMDFDTSSIERSEQLIRDLTGEIQRLERSAAGAEGDVQDLDDEVEDLGDSATETGSALKGMFAGFAGAIGAILSIQALTNGIKSFIGAADEATNITARLNLINDGMQTTGELQQKIFESAQATGGSYNATADAVGKLAAQAGAVFSSNDEIIAFTDQLNKTFSIAGTSVIGVESAMLQLTQAMAAGKLQGEELNAILDNAQPIVQNIADYMGIPVGSIKKLASEGQISADIIKNAMFAAAEETNAKFAAMPMTFGQQMQIMKDKGLMLLAPLFERFSDFVNSDTFATLSTIAVNAMTTLAIALGVVINLVFWLSDIVAMVGQFFMDNWSFIAPVLMVIAIVLGSIVSILLVKYTVLGLMRVATLAWAAAQWVVNAAYLSNPIVWVLIAIIAVIALVVYALMVWGEQTAVVIGFIAGIFAALFTFIYNKIANTANFFLAFAEFLINLFIDPVYAIKKLFYDMAMMVMDNMAAMGMQIDSVANAIGNAFVSGANMAINAINWIVDALNEIPGVDLGKVSQLSMSGSSLGKSIANFANNLEAPTSDKGVVSLPRMELGNYADNFNSANEWAYNGTMALSDSLNGLADKAKGLVGNLKGDSENPGLDMASLMGNSPAFNADGLDGGSKGAKNPTGGKLDKIGKIDDEINIAEEDLELLKEIATIKAVQNFVTLTPTVRVQTGDIQNNVDVNEVISKIENSMNEEISRSAKGAYGAWQQA